MSRYGRKPTRGPPAHYKLKQDTRNIPDEDMTITDRYLEQYHSGTLNLRRLRLVLPDFPFGWRQADNIIIHLNNQGTPTAITVPEPQDLALAFEGNMNLVDTTLATVSIGLAVGLMFAISIYNIIS